MERDAQAGEIPNLRAQGLETTKPTHHRVWRFVADRHGTRARDQMLITAVQPPSDYLADLYFSAHADGLLENIRLKAIGNARTHRG